MELVAVTLAKVAAVHKEEMMAEQLMWLAVAVKAETAMEN